MGWGVADILIKVKKDLDFSKGKQEMLISQLKVTKNYLEQEPPKKKRLYVKEPEINVVIPKVTDSTIPPLVQQWYKECEQNLEKGTIGLVPECFQTQLPPWEEFIQTNIGKTMISFSRYAKKLF